MLKFYNLNKITDQQITANPYHHVHHRHAFDLEMFG
jgi:hypothetical protein